MNFTQIFSAITLLASLSGGLQAARYALLNESKKPVTIEIHRTKFKGKKLERQDVVSYELPPGSGVFSPIAQPKADKIVLKEYTDRTDDFGRPIRLEETWAPSTSGLTQYIAIRYTGDGAFDKSDKNVFKMRKIIRAIKSEKFKRIKAK